MAFKPNYGQQRAERNRLKQAKKDAKLREREDAVAARRKADQDAGLTDTPTTDDPGADAPGSEAPGPGAPREA